MASIVVRGLEESVEKQLAAQAKEHGCSLEAEVRDILTKRIRRPHIGLALMQAAQGVGGIEDLPPPERTDLDQGHNTQNHQYTPGQGIQILRHCGPRSLLLIMRIITFMQTVRLYSRHGQFKSLVASGAVAHRSGPPWPPNTHHCANCRGTR
ncbi:FitA-like ribbon-helix-helix domain-containing protein [Specibacter sp. AOP5-B1-6]|uniref:FitA-like ribbon-helix-helix domain-containing protein n=1 Tax=Specibacter sp. AOP5-B1-6 TaxID=3457653 RepID=UPI003FB7D1E4